MDDLVSTEWLEKALGEPDILVFDASKHLPATGRDARAEYLAGHIAGACFFDLANLVDETSPVPAALPRADQWSGRLSELGYREGMRVVFYDDSAVKTSARAWFLARAFGMENVAILDGGLAKWKAEARALETGAPAISPTEPVAFADPRNIRYKHEMLANIAAASEQVVDARDAGRFTGSTEDTVHNLPSGHIPGSCNLHFVQLFRDDGTFRSPGELRAMFADAGIDLYRPVTATCGSGVTASVLLFALHLLGHEETALYDGSWSEWGADPDTPKATGEAH